MGQSSRRPAFRLALGNAVKVLAPTLEPGDIVIMDNLKISPRQGDPCRHLDGIEVWGALGQEEEPGAHARRCSLLSSNTGCETAPGAISAVLPGVSPNECSNFFAHAGYGQS